MNDPLYLLVFLTSALVTYVVSFLYKSFHFPVSHQVDPTSHSQNNGSSLPVGLTPEPEHRTRDTHFSFKFKDEAQTALFKDPARTAQ